METSSDATNRTTLCKQIYMPVQTSYMVVAHFCQPHIHLAMLKINVKNITYPVIIWQVDIYRVNHLGILTGQNCL